MCLKLPDESSHCTCIYSGSIHAHASFIWLKVSLILWAAAWLTVSPRSYSVFRLLCDNLSQTSISPFISRFGALRTISSSDIGSSLMPFMCWIVGGGGEEAQSLLGVQLSGASESDLLRQFWHLHGAPALAPTRCQGTVSAAHECLRKNGEEHKHMLRGTTHGSAALYCTLEHTWLQVEGGEKEKATKGGATKVQILLTCTLLCSMVSLKLTPLMAFVHLKSSGPWPENLLSKY